MIPAEWFGWMHHKTDTPPTLVSLAWHAVIRVHSVLFWTFKTANDQKWAFEFRAKVWKRNGYRQEITLIKNATLKTTTTAFS